MRGSSLVLQLLRPHLLRRFDGRVAGLEELAGLVLEGLPRLALLEHDLGVFREMIEADADAFGESTSVQAFVGLLDRRRSELRAEANALGGRIYAEAPKDHVSRLKVYWRHAVAEAEQAKELAEAKLPAGA